MERFARFWLQTDLPAGDRWCVANRRTSPNEVCCSIDGQSGGLIVPATGYRSRGLVQIKLVGMGQASRYSWEERYGSSEWSPTTWQSRTNLSVWDNEYLVKQCFSSQVVCNNESSTISIVWHWKWWKVSNIEDVHWRYHRELFPKFLCQHAPECQNVWI